MKIDEAMNWIRELLNPYANVENLIKEVEATNPAHAERLKQIVDEEKRHDRRVGLLYVGASLMVLTLSALGMVLRPDSPMLGDALVLAGAAGVALTGIGLLISGYRK